MIKVEIQRHSGVVRVRLAGNVDEQFDRKPFEQLALTQVPIVIDLDDVRRITSSGVREWLSALRSLPSVPLFFARARPAMVAQFNAVAHFDMGGRVVTFYAPYLCPNCNTAFETLIDLRIDGDAVRAGEAPEQPCIKCDARADFDDLEASYFAELGAPLPALPPAVALAVDGKPLTAPFALQKEVGDVVTALTLTGAIDASARLKRHADGLEGDVVVVLADATLGDGGSARIDELFAAEGARFYVAGASDELWHAIHSAHAKVERVSLDGADAPPAVAAWLARRAGVASSGSAGGLGRIGKYEILRSIGVGGMAEVLLGKHVGLEGFEKKVVIKRILPKLAQEQSFVDLFLDEARIAAHLSHPNIVQIYDLGRVDDSFYIVMEYVDGYDFNAIIRMCARLNEKMPLAIAARVLSAMCAGLSAAHELTDDAGNKRPVLHRDVSPHNLLVGKNGALKLTDFGVAKAGDSLRDADGGLLKGKIPYMAPEHIKSQPYDHRVDLYAAGLCFYYAITLEHPFQKTNEMESMRAIIDGDVRPPSALRPDVPPELDALVMRAIARTPSQRFGTAREMQAAIDAWSTKRSRAEDRVDLSTWVHDLAERAAKLPTIVEPPTTDDSTTMTTPDPRVDAARVAVGAHAAPTQNGPDDARDGVREDGRDAVREGLREHGRDDDEV